MPSPPDDTPRSFPFPPEGEPEDRSTPDLMGALPSGSSPRNRDAGGAGSRKPRFAPERVDILHRGACPMSCERCLDPDSVLGTSISRAEMVWLVTWLRAEGVRELFHRCAEDRALSPTLEAALVTGRDRGVRSTVRGNALEIARLPHLLPFVDRLVVPIDGGKDLHDRLHPPRDNGEGWPGAVSAIHLAQEARQSRNWSGQLIVETTVSWRNLQAVPEIPAALEEVGVDLAALEFELLEAVPACPHITGLVKVMGPATISPGEIAAAAAKIRQRHPGVRVTSWFARDLPLRQLVIAPDGEASGIGFKQNGVLARVPYGRTLDDLRTAFIHYQRDVRQAELARRPPTRIDPKRRVEDPPPKPA